MATNDKEKTAELPKDKISSFNIPMDEEINYTDENKKYEPIDAVCSMINKAKRDKEDRDEKRKKDLAKKQKEQYDNAVAAKKAADEKAKQEDEYRKVNEAKYMRKKSKRNAAILTFSICISSAIFSYVVFGILIWMIFEPPVWLFVGVMGIIGMIGTYMHTYLYRFIREEIYRK